MINFRAFCAQDRRRVLHRLDDLGVAGAATEVAGNRIADVVFGWVGIFVEQRFRHHQHSWRAVTALGAAVLQECFLNRMKLGADFQPFNRDHVGDECAVRAGVGDRVAGLGASRVIVARRSPCT